MMTLKEKVKNIKADLKKEGITVKQISVIGKDVGYDESIRVKIKDITVSEKLVKEIVSKYREVQIDQYNGEILAGCNTFVHVEMDYNCMLAAREQFIERSKQIIKEGKTIRPGHLLPVCSDGRYQVSYYPEGRQIILNEKPEGWETMDCYANTTVARWNASCEYSMAEALALFKYQNGVSIQG